jgi:hypothetical protein
MFIIGLNLCTCYINIKKSSRLINRIIEKDLKKFEGHFINIEKDLKNSDSCYKINNSWNNINNPWNNINNPWNNIKSIETCYPDDDNENKKKKLIKKMIGDELYFANFETIYKNEYTLIWYNCNECRQLLDVMDKLKLSNIYINGESFFNIDYFEPLLFKNDEFVSDNLDGIYKEIYFNN